MGTRGPSRGGLTYAQAEAVEGVAVNAVQLADKRDGEFHHDPDLCLLLLSVLYHGETHACQTGAFLHTPCSKWDGGYNGELGHMTVNGGEHGK